MSKRLIAEEFPLLDNDDILVLMEEDEDEIGLFSYREELDSADMCIIVNTLPHIEMFAIEKDTLLNIWLGLDDLPNVFMKNDAVFVEDNFENDEFEYAAKEYQIVVGKDIVYDGEEQGE